MKVTDHGIMEDPNKKPKIPDNWKNRSTGMICKTCVHHCIKDEVLGRCRRHAPTMSGFPIVYPTDWCGDHRLK